jgi:hypothetical protein
MFAIARDRAVTDGIMGEDIATTILVSRCYNYIICKLIDKKECLKRFSNCASLLSGVGGNCSKDNVRTLIERFKLLPSVSNRRDLASLVAKVVAQESCRARRLFLTLPPDVRKALKYAIRRRAERVLNTRYHSEDSKNKLRLSDVFLIQMDAYTVMNMYAHHDKSDCAVFYGGGYHVYGIVDILLTTQHRLALDAQGKKKNENYLRNKLLTEYRKKLNKDRARFQRMMNGKYNPYSEEASIPPERITRLDGSKSPPFGTWNEFSHLLALERRLKNKIK